MPIATSSPRLWPLVTLVFLNAATALLNLALVIVWREPVNLIGGVMSLAAMFYAAKVALEIKERTHAHR